MIQSVQLSPAEALLVRVEQERHAAVVKESNQKLEVAVRAIYQAHGWEWGKVKGQMQRDPLDTNIIRFVYDDGVSADAQPADPSKPQLRIVDVEPDAPPAVQTA